MEITLLAGARGISWGEILFALWFASAAGFTSWEVLRLLRGRLLPALGERRQRWLVRRRPACSDGRSLAEGRVARLAGTVVADGASRTRFKGREAVAFRYTMRTDGGQRLEEGAGGADFLLRLDDGTLVRVELDAAVRAGALRLLGGVGERWRGPGGDAWLSESWVAAGDRVEVTGRLRRVIDPRAHAAGPRALPTMWTIGAAARRGLVVDGGERAVAALVERHRALAAWPAEPHGALVRRSVGGELVAAPEGHWGRVYAVALMGMAVGIVCGWMGWLGLPIGVLVVTAVADFATSAGEAGLRRELRRQRTHRSLERVRPGRLAKIRGRVEAASSFVDEHGGLPAVLARYAGWTGPFEARGPRPFQEVRGVPFAVRLPSHERVWVDPREAVLLDERLAGAIADAGRLRQLPVVPWLDRRDRGGGERESILFDAAVRVGDEVEVMGLVADGPAADGRLILHAMDDLPLVVRVAPDPAT